MGFGGIIASGLGDAGGQVVDTANKQIAQNMQMQTLDAESALRMQEQEQAARLQLGNQQQMVLFNTTGAGGDATRAAAVLNANTALQTAPLQGAAAKAQYESGPPQTVQPGAMLVNPGVISAAMNNPNAVPAPDPAGLPTAPGEILRAPGMTDAYAARGAAQEASADARANAAQAREDRLAAAAASTELSRGYANLFSTTDVTGKVTPNLAVGAIAGDVFDKAYSMTNDPIAAREQTREAMANIQAAAAARAARDKAFAALPMAQQYQQVWAQAQRAPGGVQAAGAAAAGSVAAARTPAPVVATPAAGANPAPPAPAAPGLLDRLSQAYDQWQQSGQNDALRQRAQAYKQGTEPLTPEEVARAKQLGYL